MRIFILEDDHQRIKTFRREFIGHEIVLAETAIDAKRLLDGEVFDRIFLDHDLGGEEMVSTASSNTGSEVVRWMKSNLTHYCPVIIHSMNTPAALDMKHELEDMGMEVYRVPFTNLVAQFDRFIREN